MNTTKDTHGYREPPNGCAHMIMFFFAILIIAIMCMMSSCKVVEYVEVEKVKKEVEYKDRIVHDSIYTHDSIYVHHKGDTVFVDKFKYEYIYKSIHDTSFIEMIDRVPYPVEVEVITNELTSWQKNQIIGFWLLIAFIAGFIFLKIKGRI